LICSKVATFSYSFSFPILKTFQVKTMQNGTSRGGEDMNQQPSASKLGDEMYSLLDTAGEDRSPVFASTFVAIRSDEAGKNKDFSALVMRLQLQEQHRLSHGLRCEVATDEKQAVQKLSKEIAESNERKKIRDSQRISLLDEIEFLKSLIVDCPTPSLRRVAQHEVNVPSYSPFPPALINQIDALLSAATSRGFFSLDEEESPGFSVLLDKTPGEGGVALPRATTSSCDQSDCASSDKNDEEGGTDATYYRSILAGSEESSSIGTSKSHYRGWCGHRSSDRKESRPPKIPSEITIVVPKKKVTHASRCWKASKTLQNEAFLNLFADATEKGPARRQKKAKKDKSTKKGESKLKKEDLHLAWLVTVMYELMDKIETGESHKDFEPSNSRNRAA
jgi:hypothetical protein